MVAFTELYQVVAMEVEKFRKGLILLYPVVGQTHDKLRPFPNKEPSTVDRQCIRVPAESIKSSKFQWTKNKQGEKKWSASVSFGGNSLSEPVYINTASLYNLAADTKITESDMVKFDKMFKSFLESIDSINGVEDKPAAKRHLNDAIGFLSSRRTKPPEQTLLVHKTTYSSNF